MEKIFGLVTMKLAPGKAEEFKAQAKACVAAAASDLAGTTAYEWFLNDDGSECTVIEIYDDPQAIATHSKLVGPLVAGVKDLATFSIQFAGDVPDAILDRMRERLGAVEYFGRQFQGRMTSPSTNVVGPDAGEMIYAIARWKILPGKKDEFMALAKQCMALVEANEPDTIGYEWFLNPEGTACLTLDVYRNTAALAQHMQNVGPVMRQITPLIESDTTVYGNVSPEMRARFNPDLGVRYVAPQLAGVL